MIAQRFASLFLILALGFSGQSNSQIVDGSDPSEVKNYRFTIRTDLKSVHVKLYFSNHSNDVLCDNYKSTSAVDLGTASSSSGYFPFVRMYQPSYALYEWHMCADIDGVRYKAWRGYDPGPGSTLDVDCLIHSAQVEQKSTESYLCQSAIVKHNSANYVKQAAICEELGRCIAFDNDSDIQIWKLLRVNNSAAMKEVILAALDYIFGKARDETIYLRIDGAKISEALREALVSRSGLHVEPDSEWRGKSGILVVIRRFFLVDKDRIGMVVYLNRAGSNVSGLVLTLEMIDDTWLVISSTEDWVS